METPPPRVLAQLDAIIVGQSSAANDGRAGLEGRRKTNPVVDGQLVPRARKAPGHGYDALRKRPRGVDPAAPPRRSARRSRQE